MAEVFGIISGAVGIASVFSTCVECFDYIQIGRRFGKDFQTELLTLSLLKLRLSRWGEAVHVYEDPQLGRPEATKAEIAVAKDTLYQILVLFADSEKVSTKYRLTAQPGEDLSALSGSDLEAKLGALDNRMRQLAAKRQKHASFAKITRWALYDKEHYARLVEGITKLIEGLEQAFPALDARTSLVQRDVEEIIQGENGKKEEQGAALKLLQELATGIDNVVKAQTPVVATSHGISITSLVVQGNARVRDGDFVSSSWAGKSDLPQSGTSIAIGSIQAGENSRVMNGNTYADKDSFWD
ncbi:prion-inhibition and propagation-domain-containing protein [Xylariaceae sp. FL1651]|nr:prion-inhibition and propagation-domain-containing protein [Xylariaceae sp. FL1651]